MKNKVTVIIKVLALVILFSAKSFAGDPALALSRADLLYQQNKYPEALKEYEKLTRAGFESPALYYNLGNTYYRLGRTGYAILYFEKALRLAPADEDIKFNLQVANAHTADKVETLPELVFIQYYNNFINMLTVNGWTRVNVVVYLLLAGLIAAMLLVRRNPAGRIFRISASAFSVVFLVTLTVLLIRIYGENSARFGIVVEPVITVKSAPDDQSRDAFVIHEGLKVRIDDSVQGWVMVRLNDGKTGWIFGGNVRAI